MKSDLVAYLKMRKKGSEIAMLKVFLVIKLGTYYFFIAMPYDTTTESFISKKLYFSSWFIK